MEDDLLRRLAEWSAEEAASERSRRRWLEQQALEDSSLAGLLVDLAERGVRTAVTLRGGAVRAGVVRAVGADFTALDNVLIPFWSIAMVRPSVRVFGVDRPVSSLTLAAALGRLAGERPPVRIEAGGSFVAGSLVGGGGDVAVVAVDDDDRSQAFVPLGGIAAITL